MSNKPYTTMSDSDFISKLLDVLPYDKPELNNALSTMTLSDRIALSLAVDSDDTNEMMRIFAIPTEESDNSYNTSDKDGDRDDRESADDLVKNKTLSKSDRFASGFADILTADPEDAASELATKLSAVSVTAPAKIGKQAIKYGAKQVANATTPASEDCDAECTSSDNDDIDRMKKLAGIDGVDETCSGGATGAGAVAAAPVAVGNTVRRRKPSKK